MGVAASTPAGVFPLYAWGVVNMHNKQQKGYIRFLFNDIDSSYSTFSL